MLRYVSGVQNKVHVMAAPAPSLNGAIGDLVRLLQSNSKEVRENAAGALTNLSMQGDAEVLAHIAEQGASVGSSSHCLQYSSNLLPAGTRPTSGVSNGDPGIVVVQAAKFGDLTLDKVFGPLVILYLTLHPAGRHSGVSTSHFRAGFGPRLLLPLLQRGAHCGCRWRVSILRHEYS